LDWRADASYGHTVSESPAVAWDAEYCLRPYNPYRLTEGKNPAFSRILDGRLLDFKEGQAYAIAAETDVFREGLKQLSLPSHVILVIVPGHEARVTNVGRPLGCVAQNLAAADQRYTASVDTLIRTQTIPKLASHGHRSLDHHLASMTVTGATALIGATVVVLDDVVTTGHSIAAARRLLLVAGAKRVAAVALGRTVKYSEAESV